MLSQRFCICTDALQKQKPAVFSFSAHIYDSGSSYDHPRVLSYDASELARFLSSSDSAVFPCRRTRHLYAERILRTSTRSTLRCRNHRRGEFTSNVYDDLRTAIDRADRDAVYNRVYEQLERSASAYALHRQNGAVHRYARAYDVPRSIFERMEFAACGRRTCRFAADHRVYFLPALYHRKFHERRHQRII